MAYACIFLCMSSAYPSVVRNVPIPPKRGGNRKYPWGDMQIGDSFLAKKAKLGTISSVAYRAAKRLGFKFSCRTENNGVRVWRIA